MIRPEEETWVPWKTLQVEGENSGVLATWREGGGSFKFLAWAEGGQVLLLGWEMREK